MPAEIAAPGLPAGVKRLFYHFTNCYLVKLSEGWLMIDVDWPGTLPQLFRALKTEGVPNKELKYLLVTHFHPDHDGLAQELKNLGVILIVMENQLEFLNFSDAIFRKDATLSFEPIRPEGNLDLPFTQSRAFLHGLGLEGEILLTPGHSPDSVSLVLDGCCAFVGDLPPLQYVSGFNNPQMEASWKLLLTYGIKAAYPGHGPAYSVTDRESL